MLLNSNNLQLRTRLLANDVRGWEARFHADGLINLDLQHVCLVLTTDELRLLAYLTDRAACAPLNQEVLAQVGPHHYVSYCSRRALVSLLFERTQLRFNVHDFRMLARLCRRATAALEPLLGQEPPAFNYRLN